MKLDKVEKNRELNELLDSLEFNQVVILVKSVARAIELDELLVSCKFPGVSIHTGLAREEGYASHVPSGISRYSAFDAFEKRILVTTDVLSRGIDVERVNIVVNYDAPPGAEPGRSKQAREFFPILVRSRAKGLAITFVSSEDDQQVMDATQARFEVAMMELPESIDPAGYNESHCFTSSSFHQVLIVSSDIVISFAMLILSVIPASYQA